MPWNSDLGFTVSTFDEALMRYYESHKNALGYSGTYEEFKQGKYGALYYAAAQQDIRAETELSLLFEKSKDFYRIQNALIETNNLNPQGVRDVFLSELGYETSLDQSSGDFAIAILYTPTDAENAKIAELLITEAYSYGRAMIGDITKAYQKDAESQSFTASWTAGVETDIEYRVTITTVTDNSAPEQTKDEIRALFLQLHEERYTWGNIIQPQRMLTENDLAFAASVQVEVRVVADPENPWQSTPLTLPYNEKAIPNLSVNDITITEV